MFTKPNSCPVCFSPWKGHAVKCYSCGSIAELYYEHSLPDRTAVDEAKIEQNINRVRKYLVDHENHGLARYTLGLSYANLGFLPEALVEIGRSAQLLPEKIQISYEAVVLAAKQGDFSQNTLNQINRVIERKPDFIEALYLKGVILEENNKSIEAARAWQEAYKLDNNYTPAQIELQSFVHDKESQLHNPRIASSIPRHRVPKKAIDYLETITGVEPVKPPPLGSTSMALLAAISQDKAESMRRMYLDDLHRYEAEMRQRAMEIEALEKDVIALSELCIVADETVENIVKADYRRSRMAASKAVPGGGRQLSLAERSSILDAEVQRYQKQGYTLVSRTETTAQLSKQHEFDCCLAFFLVLIVIGIILYLLYYLTAKKEHLVFLEVDEFGRVHRSNS